MADKYENDLLPRPYQNIDVATDFVRTQDENGVSYRDSMANVAEAFIRQYAGASLGGTERTVQAAVNDAFAQIEQRTCTVAELEALEDLFGIE